MTRFRWAPIIGFFAAVLFSPLAAGPALAATPEETKAEVPALSAFHEVIFKIWHQAWPNKDVALLTALAPDVRRGVDQVAKAELPGILRDKEMMWRDQVGRLQEIAASYDAAIATKNDAKLLAAAENLHRQFEVLVRTIHPALKELDDFHVVLYRIYHYDLPAGDIPAIKTATVELKAKMDALDKATLPGGLAAKQESFVAARAGLSTAVGELVAATGGNDKARIKAAVEKVHSSYKAVAAVFN